MHDHLINPLQNARVTRVRFHRIDRLVPVTICRRCNGDGACEERSWLVEGEAKGVSPFTARPILDVGFAVSACAAGDSSRAIRTLG